MIKTFNSVGNETLSGRLLSDNKKATVFLLHGGGKSTTKERTLYLQKALREKNISSFSFDFSGSGESSGDFMSGSLFKRFEESKSMIEKYWNSGDQLIVCGTSMSGHVAIKLLEFFPITGLVLFVPAIYSKLSFTMPFNDGFTKEIRKNKSYLNNDVIPVLRAYRGGYRLIIGANDSIIPQAVSQLLQNGAEVAANKKILVLQNSPHTIHPRLQKNTEYAKNVINEIASLVK